jgi:hypothetical protein
VGDDILSSESGPGVSKQHVRQNRETIRRFRSTVGGGFSEGRGKFESESRVTRTCCPTASAVGCQMFATASSVALGHHC